MATHDIPATPSPRTPFDMASLQMNLPFVKNSDQEEIDKLMGRLTIRDTQASPSPMPAARHSKGISPAVDGEMEDFGNHSRTHPNSTFRTTTTALPDSQLLSISHRSLTTSAVAPDIDPVMVAFSQMAVQQAGKPGPPPTTPRATTPERTRDRTHEQFLSQDSLDPASFLPDTDVGKSPRKTPARRTMPSTPVRRRSESGSKPEFASASPITPSSTRWSPYACPRFPPGMSSESPSKRARSLRSVSDSFAFQGLARSFSSAEARPRQSGAFSSARLQTKPAFASGSRARCTACEFPTMALTHSPPCHLAPSNTPDVSPSQGNLFARMKGCPACDFPGIGYTHSQACELSHPSPMDVDSSDGAYKYSDFEDDIFGPA